MGGGVAPGEALVVGELGLDGVDVVLTDNGRHLGDKDPVGGRRGSGGALLAHGPQGRLPRSGVHTACTTGVDYAGVRGGGQQVIDRGLIPTDVPTGRGNTSLSQVRGQPTQNVFPSQTPLSTALRTGTLGTPVLVHAYRPTPGMLDAWVIP